MILDRVDDQLLAVAAFRYCLGRRSYLVPICVEWLDSVWPQLTAYAKRVIAMDLLEALASNRCGSPILDRPVWLQAAKKIWIDLQPDDQRYIKSILARSHLPWPLDDETTVSNGGGGKNASAVVDNNTPSGEDTTSAAQYHPEATMNYQKACLLMPVYYSTSMTDAESLATVLDKLVTCGQLMTSGLDEYGDPEFGESRVLFDDAANLPSTRRLTEDRIVEYRDWLTGLEARILRAMPTEYDASKPVCIHVTNDDLRVLRSLRESVDLLGVVLHW